MAAPDTPPRASILLVDDHPPNLRVLEAILGPLGHRTVQAASGEEALARLAGDSKTETVALKEVQPLTGYIRASLTGVRTRVVSMPCLEWFAQQPAEYRDTVLPPQVRARVAVEAGSRDHAVSSRAAIDEIEKAVKQTAQISAAELQREKQAAQPRQRHLPPLVGGHQQPAVAGHLPVVEAVRQDDDVGGEPVTADVRALPDQLRPALAQGTSHGPSAHRAAGVVLTVGADQEDRWVAGLTGDAEGRGDLREVLVAAPRAPVLTAVAG